MKILHLIYIYTKTIDVGTKNFVPQILLFLFKHLKSHIWANTLLEHIKYAINHGCL